MAIPAAAAGGGTHKRIWAVLTLLVVVAGFYECLRWVGWWEIRWAGLGLGLAFAAGFLVLVRGRPASDSRTVFLFIVFAICWLALGTVRLAKFFSGGSSEDGFFGISQIGLGIACAYIWLKAQSNAER